MNNFRSLDYYEESIMAKNVDDDDEWLDNWDNILEELDLIMEEPKPTKPTKGRATPVPKKLPNLPMNLINKIMVMYQPREQYINDIKWLGEFYKCRRRNKDDDKLHKIFLPNAYRSLSGNYDKGNISEQYIDFKSSIMHRDFFTPFSFKQRVIVKWGYNDTYRSLLLGNNDIKVKGHLNNNYISRKDILECCIENGITPKKSWGKKRLVQELMKL